MWLLPPCFCCLQAACVLAHRSDTTLFGNGDQGVGMGIMVGGIRRLCVVPEYKQWAVCGRQWQGGISATLVPKDHLSLLVMWQ